MSAAASNVPIACDLDAGRSRPGSTNGESWSRRQWRRSRRARPRYGSYSSTPTHALTAAASLGQREKQCCPFFEVSIDIGTEEYALVLGVADGAEEALASFVAMLTA